jgi:tRNA pseudouridine55 synthase
VDLDGILLINKEAGRTSFDTVQLVKKRLGVRKAGHSGTLDKFASGLLIVCVNRATAIQSLLMEHFKGYRGTIRFGIQTDTLDRYGSIAVTGNSGPYGDEEILGVLARFAGQIEQIPPVYSALHQGGKRLYKRALAGEEVVSNPRPVEIRSISLLSNEGSSIGMEVFASRGTYIRSLARDVAASLGTCGYLTELCRISIGSFSVEDARAVDEIDASTPLIPISRALSDFPQFPVESDLVTLIHNGVPVKQVLKRLQAGSTSADYLCLTQNDSIVAVVRVKPKPGYFKVFR